MTKLYVGDKVRSIVSWSVAYQAVGIVVGFNTYSGYEVDFGGDLGDGWFMKRNELELVNG